MYQNSNYFEKPLLRLLKIIYFIFKNLYLENYWNLGFLFYNSVKNTPLTAPPVKLGHPVYEMSKRDFQNDIPYKI